MMNPEIRLLIRSLRLYRRFAASSYNREEFSRNLVEIYIDESRLTLEMVKDHVQHVLANQDSEDMEDIEVCEALAAVIDKVMAPFERRAMTQEEIQRELSQIKPV